MYAVVETGAKQYKVAPGDVLDVERLPATEGEVVTLDKVLAVSGEGQPQVGRPYVEGAKVVARVVRQVRGRKVTGFKYKPKTRYRRTYGHRQLLSRIRVETIDLGVGGEASGT